MHRLIVAAVGLLMVAAPGWALALGGGEPGTYRLRASTRLQVVL
jgi:hypothetical protein